MCGIAGVVDPKVQTSRDELVRLSQRMAGTLRHRGPDDEAVWVDETHGVGLGHTRLSIIDLSPTGAQPMLSPSERYVLTYNGEIYNHAELRGQLESHGVQFRGSCDTEVLATGLDVWGLERTLARLDGMFAFGAWDRQERQLSLARDRFGEKPLSWGWMHGRLVFASEIRALRAISTGLTIDVAAAADVLAHKCISAPRTIFKEFRKLPPAHLLVTDGSDDPQPRRYWSAEQVALDGLRNPLDLSEEAAARELTARLRQTVDSRMVADVPVGAFLSGGVDSAGIVAFMAQASSKPPKTFTVGFDDAGFDESDRAAEVAQRLGTDHHRLRVSDEDLRKLVPQMAEVYDEPYADSSQLPTYLVSQLAAETVAVALTGDGGDELFGGYNRHVYGDRLLALHEMLPSPLRRRVGATLRGLDPQQVDRWFGRLSSILPARFQVRLPGDKARKLGRILRRPDGPGMYDALLTDIDGSELLEFAPPGGIGSHPWPVSDAWSFSQEMMLADTLRYLPNDVLVKVDRASMAVSLETRAPYLDHELFTWAWRLPQHLRVQSGIGKRVLRSVVSHQLGDLDLSQVKAGFGGPVGTWLRGPLRPWGEALLAPSALERDDILNAAVVRRLWDDHQACAQDHTYALWGVLMLRSWLEDESVGETIVS